MKYILAVWNIVVFLLYGHDKAAAKKQEERISERTLLMCAFLLGGVGAYCGMIFFRHKTRHTKFRILLPACAVLSGIVLIYTIV